MSELEAFSDFERRLQQRVSTRVVPFAWGEAFLDDDLPTRYYSNYLRAILVRQEVRFLFHCPRMG